MEGERIGGSVRVSLWRRAEGDGVICVASAGNGGSDKGGGVSSM